MERELRVWRMVAVAGVLVLACKSGSATKASPGEAEFRTITITDGTDRIEISPRTLRVADAEGEATLSANALTISGKGTQGSEQAATISSGQLSLDAGGAGLPTYLAANLLSLNGAKATAMLTTKDDSSQLILQNDLASGNTTATLGAMAQAGELRLAFVPDGEGGRGSVSAEANASDASVWMIDDKDRQATMTAADGVTKCTPKPGTPCP